MSRFFEIPILLVTFNRPESTSIVLEKIKEVNPRKLYVSSNAPRSGNPKDIDLVAQTRALFDNINSNCQVLKLFRANNLEAGPSISGAINWVFENEEMAIILEDDCVPNKYFFDFCSIMLLKFKDNAKVMHISGTRWNPEFNIGDYDYFFSHIGHIWGWATWKRAWLKYDYNINSWDPKIRTREIRDLFKDRVSSQFWIDRFNDIYKLSLKHTWDIQWQYALFSEKGLAVVPCINLIANIGTQGVHTQYADKYYYFRRTEEWVDRGINLSSIEANREYDIFHMKYHFLKNHFLKKKFWFQRKSNRNLHYEIYRIKHYFFKKKF
jgi:hypothetical protein